MGVVGLYWYICGACAILHLLSLLISYAPQAERLVVTVRIGSACGTLVAAVAALWLGRLPREHWLRQYRPLWLLLVAVAIFLTLLLAAVG